MTLVNEEEVFAKLEMRVNDFLTQVEAAEAMGISPQMLSMVLSKKRHISLKIAEFLGYRPIVGYKENEK